MVQKKHLLSRASRCELLDIPRSSRYYQPQPVPEEDLALIQVIDKLIWRNRILALGVLSIHWQNKGAKRTVNVYNA